MLLRTKITAFCLAVGLIPLMIMGIYSVQTAAKSMEQKAFDQLVAVRDIQQQSLHDQITRWKEETVIFSQVKEVYNAIGMFRDYTFGLVEEGVKMPMDEDYDGIYEFTLPAFLPFIKELGFEDAYLFDDYGRMIFSVKRGGDLGEDFVHGQFSNTNMARAYAKAVKGEFAFVDVESYAPLGGAPAAFMAAPVKSYTGDILGVAALRLPLTAINNIVNQRAGMGESGESFIIGVDKLMRSDSRRDKVNHSLMSSFANPDKGKVLSDFAQNALSGETGVGIGASFDGGSFLTAYTPVSFEGVTWGLITEIEEQEAFAAVAQLRLATMVVGIVSVFIILGATYVYMRKAIADPFARIQSFVSAVSSGDLHEKPEGSFQGEIGTIVDGLSEMVSQLKEKLGFSEGILNGMTMPCVVTDENNRVSFVNVYFLRMMEFSGSPEEYLGKPASALLQHKEGEAGSTSRAMQEQKAIFNVERQWETEKGNPRTVRIDCAPLYDLDSKLIGAIALLTDLTDIRFKEAQIQEQNTMMSEVAEQANLIAVNVSSEAEELSRQVELVGAGARKQIESLEGTASIIDAMNRELGESARYAEDAVSDANTAMRKAEEGTGVMNRTTDAMSRVQDLSQSLKDSMHVLGEQASSIGGILEVISDIADQTNLLALNAAIEAARAGDAGRGFAVVADEVRKLAERTMAATNEVNKSVRTIQSATEDNMKRTDQAVLAVTEGNELVAESGKSLEEIVALSVSMGEQIQRIAEVSREHSNQHGDIILAFEDIRSVALETGREMEESEAVVSGLAANSNELRMLIEKMSM